MSAIILYPWGSEHQFVIYGDEVMRCAHFVSMPGAIYVRLVSISDEATFVEFADIAEATFYLSAEIALMVLDRMKESAEAAE